MRFFPTFILITFSIISFSQESVVESSHGTICIYHPPTGLIGSTRMYLGDSLICKSKYNSRHEIKVYKEGKAELWTRPKEENSLLIDIKFGEKYFVKCVMLSSGKTTKMKIELVDSIKAIREYYYEIKNRDSIRTVKKFDTAIRRNTIYGEVGGQAIAYSLNYDRIFRINKKVKNSYSAGLEIVDFSKRYTIVLIPTSYNFLFGRKTNYLELGIGLTPFLNRYYNDFWEYYPDAPLHDHGMFFVLFTSPKIGWRFQQKKGGLFFKATFSPVIHTVEYNSPKKYKHMTQFNEPASYYFFEDWWEIPWSIGPALPWFGISVGYTFNIKKE